MKHLIRIVASIFTVLLFSGLLVSSAGAQGNEDNVALCHATGSESNPYELITIDAAGAFNGHLGDDHQNGEDIIPPFEYQGEEYSQNYDAEGQAILENDCEVPDTDTDGEPVGELPTVGSGPSAKGGSDDLMLTAGLLAGAAVLGTAGLMVASNSRFIGRR